MTRHEVESDMRELALNIAIAYDLEDDFYGDCYPDEIIEIENKMAKTVHPDDYLDLLDEAREIFESYIK